MRQNPVFSHRRRALYHGTSAVLEGDRLRPCPTTNVLGDKGDFVCASDSFLMAACYAIQDSLKQRITPFFIGVAFPSEWVFLITKPNKDQPPPDDVDGRVYEVPNEGYNFQRLWAITREWNAEKPVAFNPQPVARVKNQDDLMHLGVQVFTIKDEFSAADFRQTYSGREYPENFIGHRMLHWQNEAAGINPLRSNYESMPFTPVA